MSQRSVLKLSNESGLELRIVLEPYATEFVLRPGSSAEVVGRSDAGNPEFSVEYTDDGMVVWGQTPGAVYEYWQDGKLVA